MVSCNSLDKPKKPDNLIPKNKMVDIIVDISMLNAAKGSNKKVLEKNNINPEDYIYTKYNIDSLQFSESSNYYAYDVKTYEAIYLEAKKILEDRKRAWTTEEEAKRKKQDSLRKLSQKNRTISKDSIGKYKQKLIQPKIDSPQEADGKRIE